MSKQSKRGSVLKYEQSRFTGEDWQPLTDHQAMRSLMKILSISDEGYRVLLINLKTEATPETTTQIIEVWAGWIPTPRTGDIFVCVYSTQNH